MRLGFSMRQALMQRCGMCEQLISCEQQDETRQGAALFGAAKYAVCWICNQEVAETDQTHGYKCRWTRHRKKLLENLPENPLDPLHTQPTSVQ